MEPGPLNPETLESLKEYADPDDPGFLRDIVASYLSDTETRLAAAREALKAGDAPALARLLHTIRGSSLNIGADALAGRMQALERQCKQGAIPPPDGLGEGESEFLRAKAALLAWLG